MNVLVDSYSGLTLRQNQTPPGLGDGMFPDPSVTPNGSAAPGSVGLATFADRSMYPSPSLFPDISIFPGTIGAYKQTFRLPEDYVRQHVIPSITGVSFFVLVEEGSQDAATLSVTLERYDGTNWIELASQTQVGSTHDGSLWFHLAFDTPVALLSPWLTDTFRTSLSGTGGALGVYYSAPNPLTDGLGLEDDATPYWYGDEQVSFLFRVLSDTADEGTDFLGNSYRSAVQVLTADNLTGDGYWLSKPNPSQFAVESLYFDQNVPTVIDAVTLTPITSGMNFHIYYSNDPNGPGTDQSGWDDLLWTPVPKTFTATGTTTYTLPEPLVARFIKVEFSRLQARTYDPGLYQQPMTYLKHPKWVLDYFLSQFGGQEHDLLASTASVTYDLLDLAFSYYTDDILQDPDPPLLTNPEQLTTDQQTFNRQDTTDVGDPNTLGRINVNFQPFLLPPANRADASTLLGGYAASQASGNYSVETISTAVGDTTTVSNTKREALLVEKGIDPMYFFLTCRHGYRVVQAEFEQNVGYFAGVSEIAFHRHLYNVGLDFTQFNEPLSDGQQLAFDYSIPPALAPLPSI